MTEDLVYGQYQLIKLIGSGGMGRVYKAIDTTLQRDVAVKVLSSRVVEAPETLERFRSEAITLGRLSHPNIASVYSFLEIKGEYLLVMELVTGETLEDLVKREGPLSPKRASELICQALNGLEHAHSKNIIHRDIKPSNLMVTEDGVVKLMDFGIAKMAEGPKLTREGKAPGTPEYMSPEQIQGLPLDARSDLYSMGVVLFELLTGDVPFHGDTDFELMRAHIDVQAPSIKSPSSAGVELDRIIQRSLSKTAAKRFASASEMRSELQKVSQASAETTFGASVQSRLRGLVWQVRNNASIAFALMGLAAIAVIIGVLAPGLRIAGGGFAILFSAIVATMCGRSHWLALPIGGATLACGLAIFGFGFLAPANVPPPVAPVPGAVVSNAPAGQPKNSQKDDSGGDIAAQIDIQRQKDELQNNREALDQQQKDQARQADLIRIQKMITDAEGDCTTANNEHDSFGFSKSKSERTQHRSTAVSAAKDGLSLANQALNEVGPGGVQISDDDKGKLYYNMALMQWLAEQPYGDNVDKAKNELSQMQDPSKKKDVKAGVEFLQQCLKHNGKPWPEQGFQLHSSVFVRRDHIA
jgi:serine/threonine-protein kinase